MYYRNLPAKQSPTKSSTDNLDRLGTTKFIMESNSQSERDIYESG